MRFNPTAYGQQTADILSLEGGGTRVMSLTFEPLLCTARVKNALHEITTGQIFPAAISPRGALSGLWLYFSCFDESHAVSQELHTVEGSFWHGIAHRREPDPGNAAYWFRRVGAHPIFPELRDAASEIAGAAFPLKSSWDPFTFIDFCENARAQPGSAAERIAMEIQLLEWQLLFDYCARPAR